MKILIDCRPLLKNCFTEEYDRYIGNAISYLQKKKPTIEFCFLADKIPTRKTFQAISQQHLIIKKSLPGITGWKIWYQWQIPAILQKVKPDVLLLPGGIASALTGTPQCIWLPGMRRNNYLKKKYFKWSKKKLPATLANAKILFTNSEANKKSLIEAEPTIHSKIILIPHAPDEDAYPLSWEERENIKKIYTGGKEYFLINQPDSIGDFINVLKAFSQFKKRQQSNMQLVIMGINEDKEFSEKLEGFKYRVDVHLHDDPEETTLKKIWSAAYALLQTRISMSALLNSFSMHVPVITTRKEYPEGIDDDAVLHADFTDIEKLAGNLMLLYKDEKLRNGLIERGRSIADQFSPEQQVSQLWEGLLNAANRSA